MVYSNAATLHLYYDLEKPGYQGYDRRHYPEKQRLTLSETVYKPRGRAHVPSPPLEEVKWRPHGQHIEPVYSNFGPDWKSRIRHISSPRNPNAKPTLPVGIIEKNVHFMRPFPQNWQRTNQDWVYFPDASPQNRSSKRNFFADVHLRSIEDVGDENVQMTQIGHKRQVFDSRNGIGQKSDGDKTYHTVEYSPDFHKAGSTLPVVNFGRKKQRHGHKKTFVPMKNETIPIVDAKEFEKREYQREKEQTINEVVNLEKWTSTQSLQRAFVVLNSDPNDKEIVYRPRFR